MVIDIPSLGDRPCQISSTYLYYFARYDMAATSKTFCPAPLPEISLATISMVIDSPSLGDHPCQISSTYLYYFARYDLAATSKTFAPPLCLRSCASLVPRFVPCFRHMCLVCLESRHMKDISCQKCAGQNHTGGLGSSLAPLPLPSRDVIKMVLHDSQRPYIINPPPKTS